MKSLPYRKLIELLATSAPPAARVPVSAPSKWTDVGCTMTLGMKMAAVLLANEAASGAYDVLQEYYH